MATIQYEVPNNVQRMTIGVQGENKVREFLFDVTEWRQITGNIGAAEMVVQRRGDSSPYAAAITMHDNNTVSWIPVSADTAKAGAGKIQLMWIVNGQTVKTKIFDMKVDPALDYQLPDDSLDPWASWMPGIINADANYKGLTSRVDDLQQRQTSPYNFKGSVATLADLPSTGQEVNDTYYVEALKYRVTWTEEAWQQSSMDESDYADELAEVKNDITQKEVIVNEQFGYIFPAWEHGNISSGGESNTKTIARTGYIPATEGKKIKITFPSYFGGLRVLRYKQASYATGSYIGLTEVSSGDTIALEGTGLNFIRFRVTAASGGEVDLSYTHMITAQFTEDGIINTRLLAAEDEILSMGETLSIVTSGKKEKSFDVSSLVAGYVDYQNGTFGTLAEYKRTGFVAVPMGVNRIVHTFPFSSTGTDGWAVYDANGIYITGGKTTEIEIKDAYAYVAVSCRLSLVASDTVTLAFCDRRPNNKGSRIVMMGDSIIGNYNGDDSVPSLLASYSGAACYNCAFGGTTMGSDTRPPVVAIREAFNAYKIMHSIVNDDFAMQEQAIAADPDHDYVLDYFAAHINTLKNMDWSQVDIITVSYGTNDFGLSVTLDNPDNPYDTNTFTGALRTFLETLWTKYPHIKVVVFTPIWRAGVENGEITTETNVTWKNHNDNYLWQFAEKCAEVAKEYNTKCVDMYWTIGFNRYTWKTYFPANDATHPNASGRKAIAKKYAAELQAY